MSKTCISLLFYLSRIVCIVNNCKTFTQVKLLYYGFIKSDYTSIYSAENTLDLLQTYKGQEVKLAWVSLACISQSAIRGCVIAYG